MSDFQTVGEGLRLAKCIQLLNNAVIIPLFKSSLHFRGTEGEVF